ncbi:GNAT family N-acetyltransferase [Chitinophaga vietnamensis]|uniref:GNAT family N-acetyltransferase n=1 Tax=Chitinophaga vietnamensis TaxID=2593957 RepID=UPI001375F308|nr:GNAT family N-acetyltransferase [Chitinophaga vietnamensis]
MIQASLADKPMATAILAKAYEKNDTINETILPGKLQWLMDYSFEVALHAGAVYLSDDKKAVALLLFPEKMKVSFKSILRDLHFLFFIGGFKRAMTALSRERAVRDAHPAGRISHLWYLATDPAHAGQGIGATLMQELIRLAQQQQRILCVESRIEKNTIWYQKRGLLPYRELVHQNRRWTCLRTAPNYLA